MAEELSDEEGNSAWITRATYDDLQEATGLSRNMMRDGLNRLQAEKLVAAEGSRQKRRYRLAWGERGWFKLPCLAIATGNQIRPFRSFTLRSKHELHAMKLYLYLAAIRPNGLLHSEVTYERIHQRLEISERDIRKAIALLLATGLLANVERARSEESDYGPNKYYLTGYRNLLKDDAVRAIESAEEAQRVEAVMKEFSPALNN